MVLGPAKDGGANPKFWESAPVLAEFGVVKKWLQQHHGELFQNEHNSPRALAQTLSQILNFQEHHLGEGNAGKHNMARIPSQIFMDLTPGGGACKILAAAFKCKQEKQLRRFDFHSTKSLESSVEMLREIEQELLAQAVLYVRAVYVAPQVSAADKEEICAGVENLQGYMADSAEEATHVVHPNVSESGTRKNKKDDLKAIPVYKRNKGRNNVLLHWKGYPPSRASFVTCPAQIVEPLIVDYKPEVFHVSVDWVKESVKWNEWMNEEDFELEESGKRKPANRFMTIDQLTNMMDSGKPKKRLREEDDEASTSKAGPSSPAAASAPTPAKKTTKGKKNQRQTLLPGQLHALFDTTDTAEPAGGEEAKEGEDSYKVKVLDETSQGPKAAEKEKAAAEAAKDRMIPEVFAEQESLVVVPSYAAWFDYHKVSSLEKYSIPDYFSGVSPLKTEANYLFARNYMIDTYRLNPNEFLSPTAARRNLFGDVCGLLRIYAFLERWGLINYQIGAKEDVAAAGSAAVGSGFGASGGIPISTPSGSLFSLRSYTAPASSSASTAATKKQPPSNQQSLFDTTTLSDVDEDASSEDEEESKEVTAKEPEVDNTEAEKRKKEQEAMRGDFTTKMALWPGSLYQKPKEDELKKMAKECGFEAAGEDDYSSDGSCKDAVVPQQNFDIYKLYKEVAAQEGFDDGSETKPILPEVTKIRLETGGDQYGRLGLVTCPPPSSTQQQPVIKEWSDQEVLLLLEALDAHGSEWEEVAKHVGNDRTVSDCVAKFLQLPIVGGMVKGEDVDMEEEEREESEKASELFAELEGFLSTMPKEVVTAASKAALAELASLKGVTEEELQQKMDSNSGEDDLTQNCLLQCAGASYLAAASLKATLLSETEEKNIQDAVGSLFPDMMIKMKMKEAHLDTLLSIQERQHEMLQLDRAHLAGERRVYENDVARAADVRAKQALAAKQQQQVAQPKAPPQVQKQETS